MKKIILFVVVVLLALSCSSKSRKVNENTKFVEDVATDGTFIRYAIKKSIFDKLNKNDTLIISFPKPTYHVCTGNAVSVFKKGVKQEINYPYIKMVTVKK